MNLKEKKFLIFDADGVLVDSTALSCQKIDIILDSLNLPAIPRPFLIKNWGIKLPDLFELISQEIGASPEQTKLMNELEPQVALELPYTFPREIFEALLSLRMCDCYVGLLTNRSNASLQRLVAQTGMPLSLFDKIQTPDHWPHPKPDSRVFGPFANWAGARGIKPEEMAYFGDTISQDLKATQNYEWPIDFVAVVSGINTREEFFDAGVQLCRIVDFANLPNFLYKIMRQKTESLVEIKTQS
jgi:phosphoglycolate phosphatase-like HAD superfamily hydrolase